MRRILLIALPILAAIAAALIAPDLRAPVCENLCADIEAADK